MGDFFHGWRRKSGCVTLLVALAFMGWWVRSETIIDGFTPHDDVIINSPLTGTHVFSTDVGTIAWVRPSKHISDLPLLDWGSVDYEFHAAERVWFRQGSGEIAVAPSSSVAMRYMELWFGFIAVPLTLLSAYLLLVKPRVRSVKQTAKTFDTH